MIFQSHVQDMSNTVTVTVTNIVNLTTTNKAKKEHVTFHSSVSMNSNQTAMVYKGTQT